MQISRNVVNGPKGNN